VRLDDWLDLRLVVSNESNDHLFWWDGGCSGYRVDSMSFIFHVRE